MFGCVTPLPVCPALITVGADWCLSLTVVHCWGTSRCLSALPHPWADFIKLNIILTSSCLLSACQNHRRLIQGGLSGSLDQIVTPFHSCAMWDPCLVVSIASIPLHFYVAWNTYIFAKDPSSLSHVPDCPRVCC